MHAPKFHSASKPDGTVMSCPVGRQSPDLQLQVIAAGAKQSPTTARQNQLQRMADGAVLQGVLYENPLFAPDANTRPHFQALDAQVVTAANNARAVVTAIGGPVDTPKQINYKHRPNPTTWGYVVEEQLDALARPLGWNTQAMIYGARPDYEKVVGGVTLYADLTTIGQSGGGGPHIGGKLAAAVGAMAVPPNWHAADIVHDGAQPGHAIAPMVENGIVTDLHRDAFNAFKANLNMGVFDPQVRRLVQHYGQYLSHGTFYSVFDEEDRDGFVDIAAQVDDSSDGSSEFWSDDDDVSMSDDYY